MNGIIPRNILYDEKPYLNDDFMIIIYITLFLNIGRLFLPTSKRVYYYLSTILIQGNKTVLE